MAIEMNMVEYARALAAVRAAKAMGISHDPNAHYTELEKLVEEKRKSLTGGGWISTLKRMEVRRKKMTAAYVAGVSMGYLADLFKISRNAVQRAITKELPHDLRIKIGKERVLKVELPLNPTQASMAMSAVSDEEAEMLDVLMIAAKMREVALGNDDVLEPESRIGSS